MKYCSKCGNKIKENSRFCTKCGAPTKLELENRENLRKIKNEEIKTKTLLYLGAGLIILSSIIFAFVNWENMNNIFKIIFLTFEMVVFLSISICSKYYKNYMPYKTMWFIGIIFIPIILNLIAKYGILGNYLSYKGSGIFVYLAISSILCTLVYYFSYKFVNLKIFTYISYLFAYLSIIFTLYIFNLEKINNLNIVIPILCLFNLIIIFISSNKNNFSKSIINFISVILILFSILLIPYIIYYYGYYKIDINVIIIFLTGIIHILCILLFIKKYSYIKTSYIYPFLLYPLLISIIMFILHKYYSVSILISVIMSFTVCFILFLCENKTIKITSFVLVFINIFLIILFFELKDKLLIITSTLLLIFSIFTYKISSTKFEKQTCSLLLPISILLIIKGISDLFINIDYSVIYIISSIICFSIYTIILYKFNNKNLSYYFEYFAYIYLLLSSYVILFANIEIIMFIINEILWIYYFIFKIINKKSLEKNAFLLVAVILNLLFSAIKFSMSFYYILIFISVIFTMLYIVSSKLKINGEKVYFYISLISIILASLCNLQGYSLLAICVNTLIYCLVYCILTRKNITFIVKFIYTIVGLLLISKLLNYFIDQHVISNIITLIIYIIIITSMFLLEVDSDNHVLSYSIVVIFPYTYLINNIDILNKFNVELIIILLVALILIYTEKVFNIKREKDKTLLQIILISFLHIITIYINVIFNIILSIFYIFYGILQKKNSFVILGISLLLVSILINIIKIIGNLSIIYILLLVGIVLITYVFINEAKKNNKK